MEIGDKFRIRSESGTMDVVIKENIDNRSARIIGLSFPNDSKIRWEFHNDECFGLISTLYSEFENNRCIYIAKYDSYTLKYYKGFIEKLEIENVPTYQTL